MLTYNGLTDSLIKAVKDVMEGEKKVHQHKAFGFTTEQKMDPVGKHDADINNDGKVDKSDKYLHNRRKAISKAMGEKKSSSVVMNPIVKEDAQLDEADMTKISTERLREIIKSAENQRVSPGFGTKLIAAKQELKRRKNNASIEEMSSKEKMKRGLYNSQEQTQVSSGLENPHNCATHVYSEEWGDGRTITTMHADPDAQGNIAWYDVMFEHGIQKGVPIEELEVVLSESHMHSKRGKK
jgi:NhaP-type Na+/H+ and K+/H+ antiporter